jgi:hypothetical protein
VVAVRPTLAWLASALLAHAPLLAACHGGDERHDDAQPNASASASAGSAPDSGADAAHDAGPDPALGPPCVEPFECSELDCADYVQQESRSTCTAGSSPELDCDFSVDGECGRYVIRAAGNSWQYRVHYWDRDSGRIVGRASGTDFLAYCDNQHFSVFSGEADAYSTCYAAVQSAIACGLAAWPCDQLAR